MNPERTLLKEIVIIEPEAFEDNRGYFMESYQETRYRDLGVGVRFVQDNLSYSRKGTLRGLHYQFPRPQDKLVQVIMGEIFDVAVDIRMGSSTYGHWTSALLSDRNHRQMFIPAGFAHGFCVLSETAYVLYKCSDYYSPENEGGVLWSDPDLAIPWPLQDPLISPKDAAHPRLRHIPQNRLPSLNNGK
jgi:dTDP-4-dehydrorhamnose 3,5-epimerase